MSLSVYFHYMSCKDAIAIYGEPNMWEGGILPPRTGFEEIPFAEMRDAGSGKVAIICEGVRKIFPNGVAQLRLA